MSVTKESVDLLMKRCQIGCGGRQALDDAHDILAECYGTLGALSSELAALRARIDGAPIARVGLQGWLHAEDAEMFGKLVKLIPYND